MFRHGLIGDTTAPKEFTVVEVEFKFGTVFHKVAEAYAREERRISRFSPMPGDQQFDWTVILRHYYGYIYLM
jgi:hypothetical protein